MLDEFTDSEDDKAVEDILSQAFDHSVLEQIAAINCSSFSDSDHLPSHLENRFRKLKSLPTSTVTSAAGDRFLQAKSKSFTPRSGHDSVNFEQLPDLKSKPSPENDSDGKRGKTKAKSNSGIDSVKSPPDTVNPSSPESEDFRRRSLEEYSDENEKKLRKSRYGTGLNKSRSSSWMRSSSESESGSPVRRSIACLWCSPKKKVEKKKKRGGKENRMTSSSYIGDDDVDFMKMFSEKEQKKIMKRAMKEEEKVNREAEKIVKWAKQASDRMMDVSGLVHDELDDFEYISKKS